MRKKTLPPFSWKLKILEVWRENLIFLLFLLLFLAPILLYFTLPWRGRLFAGVLYYGAIIMGFLLVGYLSKRWHPVEISFDEDNNIFLIKENCGEVREVPPECIGRLDKNKPGMEGWRYAYIFEEKGKERFRGVPIPYDVDEWIQKIKRKHQQRPNHEYIKKNAPNSNDSIFDKFSP